MRHKSSIPDNFHYWQIFDNDEHIKKFLEMVDEFSKTHIDQENKNDLAWIMKEG
jgi:hypothetical protein